MVNYMMPEKTTFRARCEVCVRPMSHCLCAFVSTVPNRTKVLILQHPNEAKHPLNTARLAMLGLEKADIWVGEQFPRLQTVLSAVDMAFLLFPPQKNSVSQPLRPVAKKHSSLLVVPDGTWRNVRRIIQINPVLSTLPHLSLPLGEASQYRVRKTRESAAVATVEAIVRALTFLEPECDFQPVLRPFHRMVEQQIQAMGPEIYALHHQ